jgi:hypothetical protein
MSKILANQIANYGDDSPIEVKEGLNIPAGKPLQAAGASGSNGQVLTSTGTSIDWTTPFDGDYNSLANRPTIPAAQVRADWNAVGTVSEILNKPIVPAVPSVTVTAAGSSNLTYSAGNGQFTYTPPDLSSFATSVDLSTAVANSGNWNTAYGWGDHAAAGYLTSYTETDPVFSVSPASDILTSDITNWDTAYGWGNHASVGYVTGLDMEDLGNVDITGGLMDQQVLKWNATNSAWEPANDLVGGAQGVALTDLSVSTNPAGTAALSYNNTNGVFTYTPPDLSGYLTSYTETDPVFAASPAANVTLTKINQWDTAYGWGNHANGGYLVATAQDKTNWNTAFGWGDHSTGGYLTSFTETDPVFSASTAAGITGAEVANWNTAYGWGDHSTAGYLTSTGSINTHTDVTITTPVNGEVLAYNGSQWVNTNSASIANATISDTAPGAATAGDLWWESDTGRLKIYYNDTDSTQWVDASPPLAQPNVPVAAGYIFLDGTSPTWSGTTGYTVSGAQPGGAGTDYVITLTFPTAYSARTDYIVQATYDQPIMSLEMEHQLVLLEEQASVVFTPRRWNEDPLESW